MADAVSEHPNPASGPGERKAEKYKLDELLLMAAGDGDDEIEKLLKGGANVNTTFKGHGVTPLHMASSYGHEKVVRALLGNGADVNSQDGDGWTPLHWASDYGYEKVVGVLLDSGADINSQDKDGWTPLYTASKAGHTSVVNLLLFSSGSPPDKETETSNMVQSSGKRSGTQPELRHETQVDLADHKQSTPLHVASYWGETEIVRAIVKFKSRLERQNPCRALDRTDESKRSALHIAVEEGYPAIVRALDGADTSLTVQNETALHVASRAGKAKVVQALLQLKANPMAENSSANDEIPLHVAARNGHTAVVEQLLAFSSVQEQTRATTRAGDTALHLAASAGHHETIEKLLETFDQQTSNTSNKLGMTALHIASERGFTRVVQCLLIKARESIRTRDKKGNTVLHLASDNENPDSIKALLKVGAKNISNVVALRNNAGETALGRAILSQRWLISEMILDVILHSRNKTADLGCLDLKQALISAARQRISHNVVRLLLMMTTTQDERMKKRADIQAGRNDSTRGWTALHWAAYHGHWEVVWWLLHKSSWTTREMRTAYETGRIGLQELKGVDEHKAPQKHKEHTYFEIEELMQRQRKSTEILAPEEQHEKEKKPNNHEAKEPDERERYHLCLDMLKDPPLFEPPDSGKTYEMPKSLPDPERILENYSATIVDFYRHGNGSDLLRRSRTVPKVVYSEGGPDEIMNDARNTLGMVDMDAAKKKHYEDLRFRWIHLPANNLDWMTDLAQRIYMDKGRSEDDFRDLENFIWQSWYELPEGPSPRRYMRPGCKTETFNENGSLSSGQNGFSRVALYMPYVTFVAYTLENKNETHHSGYFNQAPKTRAQDCSPHVTHDLQSLNDLHYQFFSGAEAMEDAERYESLLKLYEGKIIHRSRTLDESYYDFLIDMNERNEDQVVTKHFSRNTDAISRGDHARFERDLSEDHLVTTKHDNNVGSSKSQSDTMKILRVDQLWLWVIDDKTIITSSTHRQDHADDPVLEKIFAYLREENSKEKARKPLPTTVSDMSFFIPKFCVGFINYCNWIDEFDIGESISQIFASSINDQADRELRLFKRFTEKMARMVGGIEATNNNGEERAADDMINSISQKRKKAASVDSITADERGTFKSIAKAATQLLQIKDIRDELNMLKAIVSQQKKVWDELLLKAPKNIDSRDAAEYTIKNIEEMDLVANRIEEAILAVMNLEQSEASINEAVSSRKQTQETIEQGRTLMVFTVITIIFLPLSFLASLFALNITDFPHTPGDTQPGSLEYKVGWLFPILFGVTGGITALAVAVAFFRPLSRVWRSLWGRGPSSGGGGGSVHRSTSPGEAVDVQSLNFDDMEIAIPLEKTGSLPSFALRNANRENSAVSGQAPLFPIDTLEEHKSMMRRATFLWKDRAESRHDLHGKDIV